MKARSSAMNTQRTTPYIIAEIGVNHDGDRACALELTHAAAAAGADAVKFQLFDADLLMSRACRPAEYQSRAGEHDPHAMLRRLSLTIDDLAPCVRAAHQRNIHAIVTVFSAQLVQPANTLPWDAYKTASPDIIHRPLLTQLAATGKPLIISTGASTLDEVTRATRWLSAGTSERTITFLQCVSAYPAPDDALALDVIPTLARVLGLPIGYSDHSAHEETGALAVRHGAVMLEKHVTYDRAAKGPDHAASLDLPAFARYCARARAARPDPSLIALGCEKSVQAIERDVRTVSRQSIVTTRELPAGHILTADDVTIKRPGTGLPPFVLADLLALPESARTLTHAAHADTPLTAHHIATPLSAAA